MEYLEEASEWLSADERGYLTPYEKSVILARLQIKEFPSVDACLIWCRNTAVALVESNNNKLGCDRYKSDLESIYE